MMHMCAKMKSKWASWISTPIFQIIPVKIPNILCFAPFLSICVCIPISVSLWHIKPIILIISPQTIY